MRVISLIITFIALFQVTEARRQLFAKALVPCEDTNGVTAKDLSIMYDHQSRMVYYNASVVVNFNGRVYADLNLYIYGLKAISVKLDPCSNGNVLKELCPVTAGEIDIQSNSELSLDITKHIPGVAFTVPDIDAYMVAKIRDQDTNELRACVRVEVSNSNTVEQTSIKWVTACLGGVGFFLSALFVFMGTSLDSMSISAVTVLMLQYYQSVAMIDMQAVERVPPIANAWAENVAWSVGIVHVKFLEKIVRWYVEATGGHPATYLLYKTRPVLLQRLKRRGVDALSKISPRSVDWARQIVQGVLTPDGEQISPLQSLANILHKRDNAAAQDAYASSSSTLVVYRGIERLAYKQKIEVTSAVLTTYIIFIFICVCTVFLFTVLYLIMRIFGSKVKKDHNLQNPYDDDSKTQSDPFKGSEESASQLDQETVAISRAAFFYMLLPSLLKGTLLKLWYVAFPSIMVFSMWEWTKVDSGGVAVVSVCMFVVCLALVLFNAIRLVFIVRKSIAETGSPGYMLYSDPKILQKFGYLYSMFDVKCYWFGLVYLVYNFAKAAFLAFAQKSGKTQALALFVIELAMFIIVCVYRPFLSKAVNGIQITSHVVVTFNACFFLFFSNLMTQPLIVNGVMGVIFFVLNCAFSLFILLYIIIYSLWCLIAHRSEGARPDHRPKDGRASYLVGRNGQTQGTSHEELAALGVAARADHEQLGSGNDAQWYRQSTGTPYMESNPFEPSIVPPNARFQAEGRNSLAESRAGTMTSENTFNALNDFGYNKHRNTESSSSFGLQGPQDSSDYGLLSSEEAPKGSKFKKLFKS